MLGAEVAEGLLVEVKSLPLEVHGLLGPEDIVLPLGVPSYTLPVTI